MNNFEHNAAWVRLQQSLRGAITEMVNKMLYTYLRREPECYKKTIRVKSDETL